MTVEWRFGNPLSQGFSDEEQTGYQELTPDAGIPFRRQVFTDIQNIVSFRLILTLNDYIDFKSFYRTDTAQGTLSFDYYDCRFDVTRTARFLGKPTYQQLSNNYEVSCTLSLEQAETTLVFNLLTEGGDPILTEAGENILVEQKFEV